MRFERLSHFQLKILKSRGFNILTSNNQLTDSNVIWFPEKVDDLGEYWMEVASVKPIMLIISDALDNVPEEHLIGEVFI